MERILCICDFQPSDPDYSCSDNDAEALLAVWRYGSVGWRLYFTDMAVCGGFAGEGPFRREYSVYVGGRIRNKSIQYSGIRTIESGYFVISDRSGAVSASAWNYCVCAVTDTDEHFHAVFSDTPAGNPSGTE